MLLLFYVFVNYGGNWVNEIIRTFVKCVYMCFHFKFTEIAILYTHTQWPESFNKTPF